jgi:hypothetical protein
LFWGTLNSNLAGQLSRDALISFEVWTEWLSNTILITLASKYFWWTFFKKSIKSEFYVCQDLNVKSHQLQGQVLLKDTVPWLLYSGVTNYKPIFKCR